MSHTQAIGNVKGMGKEMKLERWAAIRSLKHLRKFLFYSIANKEITQENMRDGGI